MNNVLNQMFLFCPSRSHVSSHVCHCSTKFRGSRVIALQWRPSKLENNRDGAEFECGYICVREDHPLKAVN